jgi:HEAT repeat protein
MRCSHFMFACALGLAGCGQSSLSNSDTRAQATLDEWREDLKSTSEKKRFEAVFALGQIGPEAKPLLLTLTAVLLDPGETPRVRSQTAWSLVHIDPKGEECLQALCAALVRDEDWTVRAKVAEALAKIGPGAENAVPDLMRCLSDSEVGVRLQVVRALGNIGPPARDALPELRRLSEVDLNTTVREQAVEAVKQIEGQ